MECFFQLCNILDTKACNISGTKATAGPQGAGFRKSAAQPKSDNRPYLQYILFATLLGADSKKFYIHGDKAGFDLKVISWLPMGIEIPISVPIVDSHSTPGKPGVSKDDRLHG